MEFSVNPDLNYAVGRIGLFDRPVSRDRAMRIATVVVDDWSPVVRVTRSLLLVSHPVAVWDRQAGTVFFNVANGWARYEVVLEVNHEVALHFLEGYTRAAGFQSALSVL